MKKTVQAIGLTALAIASSAIPAGAQFVNFRENGSPSAFLFRNGSGLTPGQEITYTLTQQSRNVAAGTPNACGYKILSPGTFAESISQVHPPTGAMIPTGTLPEFDGKCTASATGNALTSPTAGAAIPTSHYRQPDGKIAIKMDPAWTYLSVFYANVTRTAKAGKCGEIRVSVPNAKPGERAIDWTGIINIPGVATNIDLEDVNQNGRDAVCSQRWAYNSTGSGMERKATWFSLP